MIILITLLVCVIITNKIINYINNLNDILNNNVCLEVSKKLDDIISDLNTGWFIMGLCVGILIIELFIY